ncbi:hypothetical protein SLEP1_g12731 [Rubroshorea leprosula]|uniref:Uncharacterized protein n=1 Tax=Rubroshorea leprosula TaxID=152421 RepID=A0AAV5ILF8_9ROSI|nr:hypothetical protein SLEP1_g12731 [Rubroshorea leprosula]
MCWRWMEFITVSLVVTDMRLTSALDSQLYAAKLDVEQKKLLGFGFISYSFLSDF